MAGYGTAPLAIAAIWLTATALDAPAEPAATRHEIAPAEYLSPSAIAASPDGKVLFIACATAHRVAAYDVAQRQVGRWIRVSASPTGLALSRSGQRLYVTCAAAQSHVDVIDVPTGRVTNSIPAGHTAMSPVLSVDEKTLFVCNRFTHDISFIELASNQEIRRVRVSREPVSAAATPDGKYLLVANHLYDRPADDPGVAATVSVIDIPAGRHFKRIKLARGANSLGGIAVSPDGRFAAVTHLVARYYLPTKEVGAGQINGNMLSLLDLNRLEVFRYVLLDEEERGAANPWAIAWTPDGKTLAVTHAGTHEVSLLDAPVRPQQSVRIRQRVALDGNGPRGLTAVGTRLYVANYFSDNLNAIDLAAPHPQAVSLPLAPARALSQIRQGEMLFNDATLCHQSWQSCASCHDTDARMDGLNWDLLNDGLGNPKNAKSLLWTFHSEPAMWLGVRETAAQAVRAGIRHILFSEQPESVPAAMEAWLKSLQPGTSPRTVAGKLSAAAERGRTLFLDPTVGCARCHVPPWFTDRSLHDVGTRGRYDRPPDRFDTPALVELWRTAPYFHDGSAATVRALLEQEHPKTPSRSTPKLTPTQMDDLEEYLMSL